jgi:hypothetical protein
MKTIRLLLAAALLVWAPCSGAFAAMLGVNLAHHHCDNAWHGHDGDAQVVPAHDPRDAGHANVDPFSCDDCHVVLAALPVTPFAIAATPAHDYAADTTSPAQNVVGVSLFRPPRA